MMVDYLSTIAIVLRWPWLCRCWPADPSFLWDSPGDSWTWRGCLCRGSCARSWPSSWSRAPADCSTRRSRPPRPLRSRGTVGSWPLEPVEERGGPQDNIGIGKCWTTSVAHIRDFLRKMSYILHVIAFLVWGVQVWAMPPEFSRRSTMKNTECWGLSPAKLGMGFNQVSFMERCPSFGGFTVLRASIYVHPCIYRIIDFHRQV